MVLGNPSAADHRDTQLHRSARPFTVSLALDSAVGARQTDSNTKDVKGTNLVAVSFGSFMSFRSFHLNGIFDFRGPIQDDTVS
jgi:hypothetical protein